MCNQILSNQMSANPMGTSWFQWITTSPSTVQPGLESKKWENETNEAQTQGEHHIENTAIMVVPPHFNFFWVIGNQWWFKFDCFFWKWTTCWYFKCLHGSSTCFKTVAWYGMITLWLDGEGLSKNSAKPGASITVEPAELGKRINKALSEVNGIARMGYLNRQTATNNLKVFVVVNVRIPEDKMEQGFCT